MRGQTIKSMEEKHRMQTEKLDKYIKNVQRYRVVKDFKEWNWKSRYTDFEPAVNALLKQLDLQRELLLIAAMWQRRFLITKKKNNNNLN